ncbi:MAG: RNA polymerase sigma factor [Planctomycetota bacterium]
MRDDKLNDAELMARLAAGDMGALGELAQRHQGRVLSLSYRVLGDWDKAEDVAQEAFLRVYRSAKYYKPKALFTTWLYRIVVNLCLDEQRRQARMGTPLPLGAGEEAGSRRAGTKSEENTAERKEVAELVKAAVDGLPERQRLAVILHRYDGLSHEQISEVTGWTASAVESLLVRAYANLRERLDKMKDFVK